MKYEFLKQVLTAMETFESEKTDYQVDLDSFRIWLNEKFYQKESPQHLMHKMQVNTPELENEICKQILMLGRYAKIVLKKAMDKHPELVNEDFTYLYRLLDYESLTKMQLIEKNAHEKQSGLEIIKRLIKFGLVDEFPDPNDGRSKRVRVNAKGKELFLDSLEDVNSVSRILSGKLNEDEKKNLLELLKKLNIYHHIMYAEHRDDSLSNLLEQFG